MQDVNWIALSIFVVLFAFITWLGFAAAHWRKGDLDQLHEWGLGGRRFGTVITWFLVGGDVYTAYTFIAVPALAFGAGAIAFFAVPYTIIIYPLLFLVFRRLWHVCSKHGYITAGDFVRGRFGNRWLALAVTVTGIVATMPYIALQLVGIQVVIGALGISGTGFTADLPLLIAFVVLAAFTYSSGLRAPASIAVVKDLLIYVTAVAAVIVIPIQLGGFAKIFAAVPAQKLLLAVPGPNTTGAYSAYATLALGSAMALFLYPHTLTGILSASSGHAIRRNAAMLPGYTFMLGLLALFGFFVIAAGIDKLPEYAAGFKQFGNNFAVPALMLHSFPSWFRLHPVRADAVRDSAATAGRHLDHSDTPPGDARRIYPMVQFLGASGRLGGGDLRGHTHGHRDKTNADLSPPRGQPHVPGLHGRLHGCAQSPGGNRVDAGVQRDEPAASTGRRDRRGRLSRLRRVWRRGARRGRKQIESLCVTIDTILSARNALYLLEYNAACTPKRSDAFIDKRGSI